MDKKMIYLMSFVLVLAVAATASAVQRAITVPDAGFDDHVLPNVGDWLYIGDSSYTGAWKSLFADSGAWVDYGYWAADVDLPALSGNNKVYATYPADTEDYIYQILDDTYIEGATYTLSVWVGIAWAGYPDQWSLYLTSEDYTDNLSETSGNAPVESWGQVSLTYTATADDAGKKIGIKLRGDEYVTFDDVALSYDVRVKAKDPNPADDAIGISHEPVLNVYVSEDVPKNIQDLQPTTPANTLGKTTSLLTVSNSTTITDLNVELDITMPGNNADLNVFLKSPDGKQVELFTDVGFNLDDFKNTILDDEASKSIRDGSQPFTGSFKPEGRLRDFDGRDTAGDWVLTIYDDWRGNTGTLNSWKLVVESLNIISWVPGDGIASQDIYISTSFDDVNDSAEAAYQGNFAADVSTFGIDLELDQTYFWRIDSLDADGTLIEAGDIWSFSTAPEPIFVDPSSDLIAATELAKPGGVVVFAEGTYLLTSQIVVKEGVTYQGAGAGLTIIDGNDVTRAFAAWGDRGATDGQVDEIGNGVPNLTGPTRWVIDGMTIQNCVSDTEERQDILSSARDLLTNYTGSPYTLEAAQTENGALVDNPEWFDLLSGSADDDLTDVELQAYLDANPVGSDGHLVVNADQAGDGGAITIDNGAIGTIQNCEFLSNHTPAEGDGDDGGAINITGLSVVTVNNCLFDGNYAVSPDSVAVDDLDGDGGHIKVQGGSASAATPGTTLIANRCTFLNGNAEDDGGAIQSSAVGIVIRLDSCWFEANTSWDNGNVLQFSSNAQHEVTVTNCVFANNITKADNSPDRMIETNRNSKFINCTFVGNNQEDQDMIYNNANTQDTDGDGVDDESADVTQVVNCIFLNNVVGNGDHVLGSRNADFTIAAINCLFFGNTLQNGDPADNTQRPAEEVGSVLDDPLLDALLLIPGLGSPAIDAGINPATIGVTLTTDFNGDPRPQGAGYDIGAFETTPAEPIGE